MLARLRDRARRDRLSLVAAGIAFYGLLAAFPALAALISLYGLAFDPVKLVRQLAALEMLFPEQALGVLLDPLRALVQGDRRTLGGGFAGALAVALWSASRGVKGMMEALNLAYGPGDERRFLKRNAIALALTLGAVLGGFAAFALVVLVPALARYSGLGGTLGPILAFARWPVLALAGMLVFAALYRYAPNRSPPRWPHIAWGAAAATALWIAGSAALSWFVSSFHVYNKAYGAVAAMVIFFVWFLVSAYAILLGAEISAELERSR
jgi:membrane protein